MVIRRYAWNKTFEDLRGLPPYVCGHCGTMSAAHLGLRASSATDDKGAKVSAVGIVLFCARCTRPTLFETADPGSYAALDQTPGPRLGQSVEYLPPVVARAYTEARDAASAGAPAASVSVCRSIIAHVSVHLGAPSGKTFKFYVDWLSSQGHLPKNWAPWVDHIRDAGNEVIHDLTFPDPGEALRVLDFTALLLQTVFEAPGRIGRSLDARSTCAHPTASDS